MSTHESTDIQIWTPPIAADGLHALAEFLAHKGSPWIEDLQLRLGGELAGAADYFYVAFQRQDLVGHAWYTTAAGRPHLGLVGHVFTDPRCRRQGIATQLLVRVLHDFQQRGGQLMQLFTSTPYSIPFYESLGFTPTGVGQAYHETDWYMQRPALAASAWHDLFAQPALRRRPLSGGDLPAYCLLYNCAYDCRMKDRAQRIGLGLEAELAFIETTRAIAEGRCIATVLENDQTLVGIATLARSSFFYESHVAFFDVYAHAAHHDAAVPLGAACLTAGQESGVELVYALAVDDAKRRWLAELGFTSCGELPAHYRVGGELVGGTLWRRLAAPR